MDYKDDYVYPSLSVGTAATALSFRQLRPILNIEIAERWQLRSRSQANWFADGNRQIETDLAVMYGFLPGTPWFWMGPGVLGQWNSKPRDKNPEVSYWSPDDFAAYGIRGEFSSENYKGFSGLIEASFNRVRENNFDWGLGQNLALRLRYGQRDFTHLDLSFNRLHSQQGSSNWNSTNWNLSWIYVL
jgi:hypothetical protein